jgi:hypothetical protein
LHAIFRGTYWIRSWSPLSKEEERDIIKKAARVYDHKLGSRQ